MRNQAEKTGGRKRFDKTTAQVSKRTGAAVQIRTRNINGYVTRIELFSNKGYISWQTARWRKNKFKQALQQQRLTTNCGITASTMGIALKSAERHRLFPPPNTFRARQRHQRSTRNVTTVNFSEKYRKNAGQKADGRNEGRPVRPLQTRQRVSSDNSGPSIFRDTVYETKNKQLTLLGLHSRFRDMLLGIRLRYVFMNSAAVKG